MRTSCTRIVRPFAVLLLAVAACVSVSTAPAAAVAKPAAKSTTGRMTPAIGAHPHYRMVGRPDLSQDPVFPCQVPGGASISCYGPYQIRAAYGVDKLGRAGIDGRGRSITIIDAFSSPTIRQDLANFDTAFGLPAPRLNIIAPQGLAPFDPTSADQVSWAGEISLDVEWSHAIAPAATINLVLAKSDNDYDIQNALRWVVQNNVGDTISQSFGEAEQCALPGVVAGDNVLFRQAARQGMTVFASAGDDGAAQPTCDNTGYFRAASTPASDPNVTGVGGTDLTADLTTGAYEGETVWNEPQYNAAGGGGYSVVYREPAYQRTAQWSGRRGVPDVSYNAAIDGGVLVAWSSSGEGADLFFDFGGTSSGSPQWAGLAALTDQLAHRRIGMINDDLYAFAAGRRSYAALFHDITTGNNTYYAADGSTVPGFSATPGWDAASGLGSPKAQYLVPALALASRA